MSSIGSAPELAGRLGRADCTVGRLPTASADSKQSPINAAASQDGASELSGPVPPSRGTSGTA